MNKNFLFVGLGNPEKKYEKNRHNIGRNFIIFLAKEWNSSDWENNKKCFAEISYINKENEKLILAKPLVFMNNSGKSINQLKRFYNIPLKNIFVVQDDADINLGDFKISYDRGSAGHNGIKSIIDHLKSKAFHRIRIGIRPFSKTRKKAEDFVLKNFTLQENKILEKLFLVIEEEINNNTKN
ncbi:MAG TPA: aminoacyl-tRNA hydrolase [Candidatus Paceibacterota bacterium]|nr:aminoacyl-tRNA hydrolase [Candidatus Paceibacterota bacterium]